MGKATKFGDGLGFVSGLGQTVQGVSQMLNGEGWEGAGNTVAGLASTATSAAKFFPGISSAVAKNPGLAKVLGSNHMGMLAALPAATSFAGDMWNWATSSGNEQKVAANQAHVGFGNLAEALGTSALASYGGPAGAAIAGGIGLGESIYSNFLAPEGSPTSLGEMWGMTNAIVASNGGDRGKTAGMIFDAMAHDSRATTPSDGSFAGNVNHFAGTVAQSAGQLAMITNYGINSLFGNQQNSWMAQAANGWQPAAAPAGSSPPAAMPTPTPTATPTPTPTPTATPTPGH